MTFVQTVISGLVSTVSNTLTASVVALDENDGSVYFIEDMGTQIYKFSNG